ncbi:MAG: hypothetical protein KAH32_04330 [Chlamydiia bacterium]|nr:hypothetical protein [Chlamydiia bacterium]
MNVNVTKAGLKAHSLFVAVTLTGFQTSDQAKMDGINADMVKKAITDKIGIGAGQQIPNRPGA